MKFQHSRIERFRKDIKLNRIGLARLMQPFNPKITAETIRNWEIGRCKPRDSNFQILCDVLKRKPKEFFDF